MKILTPEQIKDIDISTIRNETITSLELMERAATRCFEWFISEYSKEKSISVYCGIGNNGGDGLVLSRLLFDYGFNVDTYIVDFSKNYSDNFKLNYEILEKKLIISHIDSLDSIADISSDIIIDAIFGVGLNSSPIGFTKALIEKINGSNKEVVSIDMPSGLFANKNTSNKNSIIKSKTTLTFQFAKLALLLPEYAEFSGSLKILDIGLHKESINAIDTFYHYTIKENINKIYRSRTKFSHKGTFGHSLLVGGSTGKIGAILLATKAAVKSGSGLVTALVPKCGYQILQTSVPEAMVLVEGENHLDSLYYSINPSAIGIGPGLGTVVGTHNVLKIFLEDNKISLVLDADALNHLSNHRKMLNLLPEGSVLTPHPKEFERLVGKWDNDFEKLKLATEFSINFQIILVLKGAHTAIFTPDGNVYFNSTGNTGLSTGGSGDVLTGMITSFISQGYSNIDASILAVYLHGSTADISINSGEESEESFSASNIIDNIGKAFIELRNDNNNLV